MHKFTARLTMLLLVATALTLFAVVHSSSNTVERLQHRIAAQDSTIAKLERVIDIRESSFELVHENDALADTLIAQWRETAERCVGVLDSVTHRLVRQ